MAEGTAVTPQTETEVKKGKFREWVASLPKAAKTPSKPQTGGTMAGEEIAIKEGLAMAKEVLPLVKEIFGLFGIQQAATTPISTTPIVDASTGILGVAKAIEDVAISLHEIAEALKK